MRRISQLNPASLDAIDQYLQSLIRKDAEILRNTHYFHHRYENIYLTRIQHSELKSLIDEALHLSAELLNMDEQDLHIGFWFNLMQPGDVTTLHSHDEMDELLSGVAYLTVPENSGDLVLQSAGQAITLRPSTGQYLFFDPATPHRVTQNQSASHRLSIGMNIGPARHHED